MAYYKQPPEIRRAYRERHPDMQLYINAKSRAKRFNIEFNIERSDIIIPDVCPILGIPLRISTGKASANSPTLDRVNPEKGYTKGNVKVISHKANTMKQNNTIEDMRRFIQYMENNSC